MIKEIIVVEGKNDTLNLKRYFDCDTIETHGSGLNKETIELISLMNKTRGVILFLDPDSPGEKIRNRLNQEIKGLKNAFVFKEDARTKKKVGIEHADKEVLEEALAHLITYTETKGHITPSLFAELGLSGKEGSAHLREQVAKKYHLGKCNAKTLLKRINMIGIKEEELRCLLRVSHMSKKS